MLPKSSEIPTDPVRPCLDLSDTQTAANSSFYIEGNDTPNIKSDGKKEQPKDKTKVLAVLTQIAYELKAMSDPSQKLSVFLKIFFFIDFDIDVFAAIFLEIENYPQLNPIFIYLSTLDNLNRLYLYFCIGVIFKSKSSLRHVVIGLLVRVFGYGFSIDPEIGFEERLALLGNLTSKIIIYITIETIDYLIREDYREDLWGFIQDIVDSASKLIQFEVKPYLNQYLRNHFIPLHSESIVVFLLQYCQRKRLNLGSRVVIDLLNDIVIHLM